MATEAQKRAVDKYDKKATKKILLKLNKQTDADILKRLEEVPNKQGYIKELIRRDIARQCKNCVWYTDCDALELHFCDHYKIMCSDKDNLPKNGYCSYFEQKQEKGGV